MSHITDYTLHNDDYGVWSMSNKKANNVTKFANGQKTGIYLHLQVVNESSPIVFNNLITYYSVIASQDSYFSSRRLRYQEQRLWEKHRSRKDWSQGEVGVGVGTTWKKKMQNLYEIEINALHDAVDPHVFFAFII